MLPVLSAEKAAELPFFSVSFDQAHAKAKFKKVVLGNAIPPIVNYVLHGLEAVEGGRMRTQ